MHYTQTTPDRELTEQRAKYTEKTNGKMRNRCEQSMKQWMTMVTSEMTINKLKVLENKTENTTDCDILLFLLIFFILFFWTGVKAEKFIFTIHYIGLCFVRKTKNLPNVITSKLTGFNKIKNIVLNDWNNLTSLA